MVPRMNREGFQQNFSFVSGDLTNCTQVLNEHEELVLSEMSV